MSNYYPHEAYHLLETRARKYDSSIPSDLMDRDTAIDDYEGFDFSSTRFNNVSVVSFISEPIFYPILNGNKVEIVEKAAADVAFAPLLAYTKHTHKKSRNLPSDRGLVVKTLSASVSCEKTNITICGAIEEGRNDAIVIRTRSRYSIIVSGLGLSPQEIREVVDANTRDKSKSKVSCETCFKLDTKGMFLRNVVTGDLRMSADSDAEMDLDESENENDSDSSDDGIFMKLTCSINRGRENATSLFAAIYFRIHRWSF